MLKVCSARVFILYSYDSVEYRFLCHYWYLDCIRRIAYWYSSFLSAVEPKAEQSVGPGPCSLDGIRQGLGRQ